MLLMRLLAYAHVLSVDRYSLLKQINFVDLALLGRFAA